MQVKFFKKFDELTKEFKEDFERIMEIEMRGIIDKNIPAFDDFYLTIDKNSITAIFISNNVGGEKNFFKKKKQVKRLFCLYSKDKYTHMNTLNILNKKYQYLLVQEPGNLNSSYYPRNFTKQIRSKKGVSILNSSDNYLFADYYMSNVRENFMLESFLDSMYYDHVKEDEVEFKITKGIFEFNKVVEDNEIFLTYDNSTAFNIIEPYDKDNFHVIGVYRNQLVFDLCVKESKGVNYFAYISTRKDCLETEIEKKGIEFFEKNNPFNKVEVIKELETLSEEEFDYNCDFD